jgi:hypothetical protein
MVWIQSIIDKVQYSMEEAKNWRPSAVDDVVIGKLVEARSKGTNDSEACLYAWIANSTLYEFQNKYPQFTEYKEQVKKSTALHAKFNVSESVIKWDLNTSKRLLEKTDSEYKAQAQWGINISFNLKDMISQAEVIEGEVV